MHRCRGVSSGYWLVTAALLQRSRKRLAPRAEYSAILADRLAANAQRGRVYPVRAEAHSLAQVSNHESLVTIDTFGER